MIDNKIKNKKQYMIIDTYQNHSNYNTVRYDSYSLRRKRYSSKVSKSLFQLLLITALMILLGLAFVRGIDKHTENQDTMLCESAKISGNAEYLRKCQCYYDGQDITCLQQKSGGDN